MLPFIAEAANFLLSSILGWIIILIGLGVYFTPSFIASSRDHESQMSIILFNTFAGWSVIGWVIALYLALSNPDKELGTSTFVIGWALVAGMVGLVWWVIQ